MGISTIDLEPGDVFQDERGNLYVVRAWCAQPTVSMELIFNGPSCEVPSVNERVDAKATLHGGVSGLMWDGFTKVASTRHPSGPKVGP